jgi:hypothetical protein
VPGYEASALQGIGAPKKTPAEIVDKLNKEINAGLVDPKLKARFINGKLTSRREVVTKHGLLTEQWPERSYNIPDKSLNAVCGEVPVECIVTGTIESSARSLARNAAMSVLESFTYVLRPSGNTFIIKEENFVLRRPPTYTPAY